jgi:hypothetical protein
MSVTALKKDRCSYRSPSGRRCRNESSIGWDVCDKHGDFRRAYDAAEEIISNRDRLDTAEGIHLMMARAARAMAAGQISPRRAGMFFYGGRAMQYSLRRVLAEREKIFLAREEDVWQEKALAESHHDKLNCVDDPDDEDDGEK